MAAPEIRDIQRRSALPIKEPPHGCQIGLFVPRMYNYDVHTAAAGRKLGSLLDNTQRLARRWSRDFEDILALKTAYDEKSLFPTYIRDFEVKMKNYHSMALSQTQPKQHGGMKARPSLQNIGLQLGQHMTKGSPKSQALRHKGLTGLKLKPISQGIGSRRSSVTTES